MRGHDWRHGHGAKELTGEQRRARLYAWTRWVARGLLALVLGGGLAMGTGVSQAEANKPPEAKLKLRKRKAEPYWGEVDASHSRDKDGTIEQYRFWVTEEESGVVVREPLLTGEAHHGYALGPGKYRFYVEVEDNEGATDMTSNHLRIKNDV